MADLTMIVCQLIRNYSDDAIKAAQIGYETHTNVPVKMRLYEQNANRFISYMIINNPNNSSYSKITLEDYNKFLEEIPTACNFDSVVVQEHRIASVKPNKIIGLCESKVSRHIGILHVLSATKLYWSVEMINKYQFLINIPGRFDDFMVIDCSNISVEHKEKKPLNKQLERVFDQLEIKDGRYAKLITAETTEKVLKQFAEIRKSSFKFTGNHCYRISMQYIQALSYYFNIPHDLLNARIIACNYEINGLLPIVIEGAQYCAKFTGEFYCVDSTIKKELDYIFTNPYLEVIVDKETIDLYRELISQI